MHLLAAALALTLGAHKPRIAILDVQDVSGDQAVHARLLTQIITGEIARDPAFEVISAAQVKEMLGFSKQKELFGCNQDSCLAEIGGALGVDYLVLGQLGKIGSRFRLDLSLVDQAKARTVAAVGDFLPDQEDALANAAVDMTNNLLIKAGLRHGATESLTETQSVAPKRSRAGAYACFGVAGALLAGAAVMTFVTHSTYKDEVQADETALQANPGYAGPSSSKLSWMGPLTDALWAGGIVTAGVGTYLFFSASPSGSGGEVGVGGRF